MMKRAAARLGLCGWLCLSACAEPALPSNDAPPPPIVPRPEGFPAFMAPADNEPTLERFELGRRLFYDGRLSRTGDISCSSCHVQKYAFSDPNALSTGVDGRLGARNASALVNLAWGKSFFWHGGAVSLEVQAVGPIKNPLEMDTSLATVAKRLAADRAVASAFQDAYAAPPSESTIPMALATFVRALVSANSPYDRWQAGDEDALSPAAKRGEAIFYGERGECFHCHAGYNFTNNTFKNDGTAADDPDPGRQEITLSAADFGQFKIPTLRNVAVSGPYMHDGSLTTLDDVIASYVAGGRGHPKTDPTIEPLDLEADDAADLREFLRALTDDEFLTNPRFAAPAD